MGKTRYVDVNINGKNYLVSSDGKVYRQLSDGVRELKKHKRNGEYEYVAIQSNGKRKKYAVHRLVCIAFHENPCNKPQVNHIDGNPGNNKAENLEWVYPSENQFHSRYTLGNQTGFKDKPIICIDTGEIFVSTRDVWRKTGINYSHISECASGKRKTAGGRRWVYASLG